MDHLCEVIPRGEHFPRPVHIAYALDKALFRHPVQDGIEDILAFILASGMFFSTRPASSLDPCQYGNVPNISARRER